jgi:hypothetical protein
MPVGPDETEQLLSKLEAELAVHQKVIDERLAREEAERMHLENEVASWTRRREQAESKLEEITPRRNAMIQRRDQLRQLGSKGNFGRAMLWSMAASLLFMGATLPIAIIASKPQFFLVLLLEGFALLGGFGVIAWLDEGKDE